MKRIACIYWIDANGTLPHDDHHWQIVERCGQFSPVVGFDSVDSRNVFVDITGLAHLFGGDAAMAEAIVRDLAQFGYSTRIAVANTLGAAWAAVHFCEEEIANCRLKIKNCKLPGVQAVEPICNSECTIFNFPSTAFLGSLPIEALRLPADMVRVLHELGLVRIDQLESLPREEFLPRFGPALLQRLDQAFGRLDEPVPACPLPPKFEAGWSAEYPSARRETIAAVVEWLTTRVAAMLARYGRGALRFDCRIFLESCDRRDGPILAGAKIAATPQLFLSVGLFQPTADAKRLFNLLQLQMERLRIGSPVTTIKAAATISAPLEPPKQAMLFDFDGDQRRPHHLTALIERLCSRLGSRAVVGVRLRSEAQPEHSWHYDPLVGRLQRVAGVSQRTIRPPKSVPRRSVPLCKSSAKNGLISGAVCKQAVAHEDLPPRPLRLLPHPLPAAVTSIAPAGPPLRFVLDGCKHEVARSWGPERIETGWWRGQTIGRDYFRVETTAGNHFWLFYRLRDGKWFLHGLFD